MALIVIHVFTKQTAISLTLMITAASSTQLPLVAGFDEETLAASLREKRTFWEF